MKVYFSIIKHEKQACKLDPYRDLIIKELALSTTEVSRLAR